MFNLVNLVLGLQFLKKSLVINLKVMSMKNDNIIILYICTM